MRHALLSHAVSRSRLVVLLVGFFALLLALGSSGSASAAGSWTLVDSHQIDCFYRPNGLTQYYFVWLKGNWSQPVTVSVSGTPAGSTSWTYDSPIAPGSSDGQGSLAYVAVELPTSTPNGAYTARLTATDGANTESVPVGLTVQDTCSGY